MLVHGGVIVVTVMVQIRGDFAVLDLLEFRAFLS